MKNTLLLLSILFLLGMCIVSCENETKKPPPKTPKVQLPKVNFSADSAYQFVQKQVDFGPRGPGTTAHKACAEWLEATLKGFGTDVIVQEGKVSAPIGGILPMYNIVGAFNPRLRRDARTLYARDQPTDPFDDGDSGGQVARPGSIQQSHRAGTRPARNLVSKTGYRPD